MLRFGPGLYCRVFRLELALVFHHVSQWATLADRIVDVQAIGDTDRDPREWVRQEVTAALRMERPDAAATRQLSGYLLRNLGPQYAVRTEDGRIVVEWDARRKCTADAPGQADRPVVAG